MDASSIDQSANIGEAPALYKQELNSLFGVDTEYTLVNTTKA